MLKILWAHALLFFLSILIASYDVMTSLNFASANSAAKDNTQMSYMPQNGISTKITPSSVEFVRSY